MPELVPLKFDKILRSKSYASIVMEAEKKKFAIYIDLTSGRAMQTYLTDTERPRPSTHDLMAMIFRGLEIKIKQVIIWDLQETIYFAKLYLEQQTGELLQIVEIDARPSDCITLALIHKAPLYCTRDVLERVIGVVEE